MTQKDIQALCRKLNASPWQQSVLHEELSKSWHTGTPTEDGTFLVLWKDTEEPMRRFSVLYWNEHNDTWYDEETTYCNWGDEYHAEVIAWQKIEPYRG